jgi:penicillin-binding protein 1A
LNLGRFSKFTDIQRVKVVSAGVIEGGHFICPKCESKSKLSRLPSAVGIYKITCYKCKHQTLYKVEPPETKEAVPIDSSILQVPVIPPVMEEVPIPETPPVIEERPKNSDGRVPLFEIKKVTIEDKPSNPPESSFWEYLPPFFRNKFLLISLLLFFLLLVLGGIPLIGFYNETKLELNELLLELGKNKTSKILDRNGEIVSEIFQKKTSSLSLEEYPPKLIDIILAVEDRDFYSHSGIDYFALLRAVYKNLESMNYSQGASTVTQQLARILIKDRRKSIKRKFREAMVAFALESKLSKDKILEAYMNQVYLGHGAFGFEIGANYYFEKSPKELGVMEMALLASLASNPNKYSPFKNRKLSKKRVKIILRSLINKKIISDSYLSQLEPFFEKLQTPAFNTVFGSRYDAAPYVTEHIREVLKSVDPNVNIYDVGGYTIETTLSKDVQGWLPEMVKEHLTQVKNAKRVRKVKIRSTSKIQPEQIELQAAVIGLDPQTGAVLFMQGGGENFHSGNQFNRALQMKRQTGSAIKPVLYSAGIDMGLIYPSTRMMDAPIVFRGSRGNVIWSPDNFGQVYEGEITVRDALAKSKNTIAVQIGEQLGITNIEKYYSKYFFVDPAEKQKRFRADLSITLGSLEISPLEMASAFSNFANDGVIRRPYLVTKITDSKGKVVYRYRDRDEFNLKVPEERRVIQPDSAEVMVSIMKGSANAGGVRAGGYAGELIGKTGTTNDHVDAWFVGTKPRLSMAVWVGYDESSYGMGPGAMGASIAGPLWGKITKRLVTEKVIPEDKFQFSKRASWASICRESGHLMGPACTNVGTEIFPKDRKPPVCKITHGYQEKEILKNLFE